MLETWPCWVVVGKESEPPLAVFGAAQLEDAIEYAREKGAKLHQGSAVPVQVYLNKDWAAP